MSWHAMQIFFEANTADFAKRKRVARACQTCQKRKKRCNHVFKDQDAADDPAVPVLAHKEPVRFVGDLNPESVLRDLSSRSKGDPRECEVGVFVDPALRAETNGVEQATSPNELRGRRSPLVVVVDRHGKIDRGFRTLSIPEKSYLQSVGAFRKLPRDTEDVLITTWFSCLDGIIPILDGAQFLHDYASKPSKISPFLILAMCLITCKTEEALPFLRLTENGPLFDPITFARTLYVGLDAAMKLDLEADRVTKVQILALMSLHNDSPSGLEDSSYHLSHAIHDANTSALHIQTTGRRDGDQQNYVWWCLWVFDKINACISGRAIMINDRDIGIPKPPFHDNQKNHSLLIWIAIGEILLKVVDLYRPTSDHTCTGWEENFPEFAEVVQPYNYKNLQDSEQKILEIFYNVAAILSCRTASPGHPSYARRLHAGNEIQRLMAHGYNESIPPFPLVPYAVSLSLTVAYRVIRDRNFSTHDADAVLARQNLATRCEILESLSPRYWPADAMAKLGRKALLSLRKPGVDRMSTAGLAKALDDEVTVCKDTTFGGHARMDPVGAAGAGNALHVLSSAAAEFGGIHHHNHSHHGNHHSLIDNGVPLIGIEEAADANVAAQQQQQHAGEYTPALTEGSTTNPLHTPETFQNLDNLFDEFFDLGMPTFFQDPLFDGAAFGFEFEGMGLPDMDGNLDGS